MSFISRAWRGEERLWKVFWLYGYVIPLLGWGLSVLLCLVVFGHSSDKAFENMEVLERIASPFINFYYFIWIVIVYRCANNTNEKSWGVGAKVWCGLTLLALILRIMHDANTAMVAG